MLSGLKIGDVVAVTWNRVGTWRLGLELPDGRAYDLNHLGQKLDVRQAFGEQRPDDELEHYPADHNHLYIAVDAINIGLALVAGVRLEFKGWCLIETFQVIERIFGRDVEEEGDVHTVWYSTGPCDPTTSHTGEVYELTPAEGLNWLQEFFWNDDVPFDDEAGKVALLFEIVTLVQ